MFRLARLVALVGALALTAACTQANDHTPPTIILVSLDGFRWDYLDHPAARTLQAIAHRGVRAEGLIPIFPSKTFPNHYTMVTGLYSDRHGLVANNMLDPTDGARYSLGDREAVGNGRWYGGEPIWVTAERAGQKTAPLFWPGSEAEIAGYRPTYWRPFSMADRPGDLVAEVLSLLDAPAGERPTFITLYFHETDDVGHEFGIASPQLDSAIGLVDRALAELVSGLEERGLSNEVDLIVVSDHGMTDTNTDRVIMLDDLIDLQQVTISDWNPVAAIWPAPGAEDAVYHDLQAHPHLTVYRKNSIPERLHYREHERIAPLIGVADEGWSISTRDYVDKNPKAFTGATHGYDPSARDMMGLFVAAGPSFRSGVATPPLANIHLYELMSAILGLEPAPNDGDLDSVAGLLTKAVLSRPTGG